MKKYLLLMSISYCYAVGGLDNSGEVAITNNSVARSNMAVPTVGTYTNSSGRYAGSTATMNGSTVYLNNGKYQAQAPSNTSIYINNHSQNQSQINFINQLPE